MILLKLTCKNCNEYHHDTANFLGDCTIRKCPHCERLRSDFELMEIGEVEHITTYVKVKGKEREYII